MAGAVDNAFGRMSLLSMDEVNSLDYEDFVAKFGNVVEHCRLCPATIWEHRPFEGFDDLFADVTRFLDQLPSEGKRGILRVHPDLAGKIAQSGQLSSESAREQKDAGLAGMTSEERARLNENNMKYRDKFGFPFVICARHNKKDAIMKGIEARLMGDREAETLIGIEEVKKICYLRLCDIVGNGGDSKL